MSRVWRLLPPRKTSGELSSRSTRAPARFAVMAAHNPALPPPTTSTSKGWVRSSIASLIQAPREPVKREVGRRHERHAGGDTMGATMKITGIQAIPLAIPLKPMSPASAWTAGTRKQIVVRVLTDEGLTGIGEAFGYGAPLAVCAVIDESLAPLLVGQDPSRIEALVDLMHRGTMIYGRRGLAMFAISGVEIALWDLLGRALGAPVWALLGGATRPRLPVYASLMRYDSPADVAAACRQFVGRGFSMLKLH